MVSKNAENHRGKQRKGLGFFNFLAKKRARLFQFFSKEMGKAFLFFKENREYSILFFIFINSLSSFLLLISLLSLY